MEKIEVNWILSGSLFLLIITVPVFLLLAINKDQANTKYLLM